MDSKQAINRDYAFACSVWGPDAVAVARLDEVVRSLLSCSRRQARCRIAEGGVWLQHKRCRIATKPVRPGQMVAISRLAAADAERGRDCSQSGNAPAAANGATAQVRARPATSSALAQEPATLQILYLDRWLIIVNKPAGLLSEACAGRGPHVQQLLVPLLAAQGHHTRLWLVHRLDAMTSGVLVLARTPGTAAHLGHQFAQGQVHKHYVCLTHALPKQQVCTIRQPIGRIQGTKHGVQPSGKAAQTSFRVQSQFGQVAYLQAIPKTGRTHQIRVHASWAGFPLLGDHLYGGSRFLLDQHGKPMQAVLRTMLHAEHIRFRHPAPDGDLAAEVTCSAPIPPDFADLLARLRST